MKRTHDNLSPEHTIAELAHFAWCAQIALRTAQQDGLALSPLSIHTFLLRWLTVAYKQKRFSRAIASDIEGLIQEHALPVVILEPGRIALQPRQ